MTEATSPINTTGDTLGAALNDSDFIRPGCVTDFSTVPTWLTGKVEPLAAGAPVPALDDPNFYFTAGYVHATAAVGDGTYAAPGKPWPDFSFLTGDGEVYLNKDAVAETGCNPFSVDDGILTITARPMPAAIMPYLAKGVPTGYLSGALCTYPFGQTYGYFEIKARIPKGQGLWPAFWMVPVDLTWPPEIDVIEVLGSNTEILYTTLHDPAYKTETNASTQLGYATNTGVDLSAAFHTYGVDWGPETIRFYLDRKLVFSEPTPANMHKPFYWITNLAVGGATSWGGAPDATTVFPAELNIAYVQTWQRQAYLNYLNEQAA